MTPFLLRWASLTPHHTLPLVADLERDGWYHVGNDPRYPSILMRKDVDEA